MGACNIEFELNKKAKIDEIRKAFREQQEVDRQYNGIADGYSGDFQTVDGVELHLNKVFNDYDSAYDYCLGNAQKWHYVVAVYYKDKEKTKTLVAGWGAC